MYLISLPRINSLLTLSCICGAGLSLYGYYIGLELERNDNYKPMCDINPQVSCSKAMQSKYGKGLGIFGEDSQFYKPNSLFGIMFYSMIATLVQSNSKFIAWVSLVLIALSNFLSIYFAYILYFVLYDLCIVCVAIYAVNVINLLLIKLKLKTIDAIREQEEEKNK
ncbi:unnamed protein product [Diabrotica balteata]|uniref:vitamin-K-epoxide reductase (warfarin-sensitive) n=1 Tax=Diabrotica balteata TaxID=107213 RepID=A0A9N9X9W0_DIABA|nr:unnamed protein product [Diabrotica balteata]